VIGDRGRTQGLCVDVGQQVCDYRFGMAGNFAAFFTKRRSDLRVSLSEPSAAPQHGKNFTGSLCSSLEVAAPLEQESVPYASKTTEESQ
jgi:hypothetical protein